jgi:hypothetical protein
MEKPDFMLAEHYKQAGTFHAYLVDMDRINTLALIDYDDPLNCRYVQVPVTNNKTGYDYVYKPHDIERFEWFYNRKRIDLPHENIYEFYYALRKLLVGAMLEYELSRLA